MNQNFTTFLLVFFSPSKSEAAFIYDAFLLLANTIDRHNLADILPGSPSVSCEAETTWSYGDEFMAFVKMSSITGLSGKIEFDATTGCRKNLTMHIVDLARNGVSLVGNWVENKPDNRDHNTIHIIRSYEKEKKHANEKLGRHLVVTTKLVRRFHLWAMNFRFVNFDIKINWRLDDFRFIV